MASRTIVEITFPATAKFFCKHLKVSGTMRRAIKSHRSHPCFFATFFFISEPTQIYRYLKSRHTLSVSVRLERVFNSKFTHISCVVAADFSASKSQLHEGSNVTQAVAKRLSRRLTAEHRHQSETHRSREKCLPK